MCQELREHITSPAYVYVRLVLFNLSIFCSGKWARFLYNKINKNLALSNILISFEKSEIRKTSARFRLCRSSVVIQSHSRSGSGREQKQSHPSIAPRPLIWKRSGSVKKQTLVGWRPLRSLWLNNRRHYGGLDLEMARRRDRLDGCYFQTVLPGARGSATLRSSPGCTKRPGIKVKTSINHCQLFRKRCICHGRNHKIALHWYFVK